MAEKYFGDWADYEGMRADWFPSYRYGDGDVAPDDFPSPEQIIIASYTYEDYSGSAFVIYEKDGKLYEVHGSHCSCYGLEDQWSPEETSWEAIGMRSVSHFEYCFGNDSDGYRRMTELLGK